MTRICNKISHFTLINSWIITVSFSKLWRCHKQQISRWEAHTEGLINVWVSALLCVTLAFMGRLQSRWIRHSDPCQEFSLTCCADNIQHKWYSVGPITQSPWQTGYLKPVTLLGPSEFLNWEGQLCDSSASCWLLTSLFLQQKVCLIVDFRTAGCQT